MANSKSPLKNNLAKPKANKKLMANKRDSIVGRTQAFLENLLLNQKLNKLHCVVAFSGGLDSTVLLHVLAGLSTRLPITLSAAHVHHGLSNNADAWADFCALTCDAFNVPFQLKKVSVDKNSGLGLEAAARNARYQALASMSADFICLAQHQDDQAETLLLQLARGSGVKGLAGMAQIDLQRKLLRPFLHCSRAALHAYAKLHTLDWVEDESNLNLAYDRNFVRHSVLPVLRQRYPAIDETLSRSAAHLAEASQLLNELAKVDSENITHLNQSLNFKKLALFSPARQGNVMRWWLAQNNLSMPSTQRLQQILQQLLTAKSDASIKIKVSESLNLMRYQQHAYLVPQQTAQMPFNLVWQGEKEVRLPDSSHLIFEQIMGTGLIIEHSNHPIKLRIKTREGGEKFKPTLGRPSRSLKYLLQAGEIPPWQRTQLPLIFLDETLVYVPNVGASAAYRAKPNEMGWVITWHPA